MTSTNKYKDLEKIFNILEKNNIFITPLNNIKEGNNNKNIFGKNLKEYWENIKECNYIQYNKVYEALNNKVNGYAIRTGKYNGGKNGLLVVDYDIKTSSNPDILNKLHNLNTLTFKTPSNGFHFLFRYTDLLSIRTELFGNVDIITDNKPIFAGIREDGEYTLYNNNTIKNLSNDIIIELNEYQPKKEEFFKQNKTVVPIDNVDYSFDISNEGLLKILDYLPNIYVDKWDKWVSLTFIFKKYDLFDVWNEWSKKSIKYDEAKNKKIWDDLKVSKDIKNLNYIIFLVNHYIKDANKNEEKYKLFKCINKVYNQYKPLSTENIKKAIKINKKHIDFNIYTQFADIIIKSGTNTGKSFSFREYIKHLKQTNPNIKVLTISHLISLCEATIAGFKKDDLNITDYKEHNTFLNKNIIIHNAGENENENENNNIAYVINSIDKIYHFKFDDYIVYLDEIHALIKVLLTSSTLNNKRKHILRILTHILKNCKQIIATDGGICDNVLTYIKKLNRLTETKFYINDYKAFQDKKAYFINDYDEIFEKMKYDAINNIDFMVCCNTRKEAENIKDKLKHITTKIKIYTSHEGEILGDVNKEWSGFIVIFSPSIIEGVDDNNPKNVYVFVNGNTTINPEQVSQQIARNRNPLNTYIYINVNDNELEFKNIEELKYYYRTNEKAFIGCYADLVDTKTSIADGVKIMDNDYSLMFYEVDYNERLMKSSFQYYLKEILLNKGYILDIDLQYTHYENKIKNNNDDKDVDNDNVKILKYIENNEGDFKFILNIENKCDVLGLTSFKTKNILTDTDKEYLNKYKDLLIFDKSFNNHLNNRSVIKTIDYLKKELKEQSKKDFNYKLINSRLNQVITFRTLLKKYFPNINPFNFSYNEKDILKVDMILDENEYINLKKCFDSKKQKPNNNIDILRMLYTLAKNIYGDDIIKMETKTYKDEKQKSIRYNIIRFNEDLFKSHLDLYNIYLKKYENQRTNIEPDILIKYFS